MRYDFGVSERLNRVFGLAPTIHMLVETMRTNWSWRATMGKMYLNLRGVHACVASEVGGDFGHRQDTVSVGINAIKKMVGMCHA